MTKVGRSDYGLAQCFDLTKRVIWKVKSRSVYLV